ncbi:hypothetical protein G9F73_012665 [Clostridium estertheticum]|nr:hypothetical protein [Clostridium estertheticum]MBZ9608661.1 hypothetical protein [Clostridium estertheticum]
MTNKEKALQMYADIKERKQREMLKNEKDIEIYMRRKASKFKFMSNK